MPLVCAWWEAGDDDGEEGGVVIGVLDDGEVLGENDAGAGAAALGDAELDGVGESAMAAVVLGELEGVDEAVIEADKDGETVGLVVPELDAVLVGVCEPVGVIAGLCEALGVADGVADGDTVADGVVVADGVCVGVPVLELDAVRAERDAIANDLANIKSAASGQEPLFAAEDFAPKLEQLADTLEKYADSLEGKAPAP